MTAIIGYSTCKREKYTVSLDAVTEGFNTWHPVRPIIFVSPTPAPESAQKTASNIVAAWREATIENLRGAWNRQLKETTRKITITWPDDGFIPAETIGSQEVARSLAWEVGEYFDAASTSLDEIFSLIELNRWRLNLSHHIEHFVTQAQRLDSEYAEYLISNLLTAKSGINGVWTRFRKRHRPTDNSRVVGTSISFLSRLARRTIRALLHTYDPSLNSWLTTKPFHLTDNIKEVPTQPWH